MARKNLVAAHDPMLKYPERHGRLSLSRSNDHNDPVRGYIRRVDDVPEDAPDLGSSDPKALSLGATLRDALAELRRRWLLALFVWLVVATPFAVYAYSAVPTYTSSGVLQVSSQAVGVNPLLELAGAGGGGEVNTEVEIIKRRDFLLAAFKRLKLQVIDPKQPQRVAFDTEITLEGQSPVSDRLRRVRNAVTLAEVEPSKFANVPVLLEATGEDTMSVRIGKPEDARTYDLTLGERLETEVLTLELSEAPLDVGDSMSLMVLTDGALLDLLSAQLTVSNLGTAREPTNLVRIGFTSTDRFTAQQVVATLMDQYLEQSLEWRTQGATNAARFVRDRLGEAKQRLTDNEEELRTFAEGEQAVQLDTQARVTIENSADLEATRLELELQQRVLGNLSKSLKGADSSDGAHLTASLVDDPVLAGAISSLTNAETKQAMLEATLAPGHPEVAQLSSQIDLQRKKVARLVKNARKNASSKMAELQKKLDESATALSSYPAKELQLARLMRDVEVSQRLYSFLLERSQEAEILQASTTIDKRLVDLASLPHRAASPRRGRLLFLGWGAAFAFSFVAVFLARALQRKLPTVSAVREVVPFPLYGTVPKIESDKKEGTSLKEIWASSGGASEAFRALCVSVSLAPATGRRARIVQVTSSQPGEGKSTVCANLAVSLSRSGAKVLVMDLDLRKPTQHRQWNLRRAPGYADVIAQGGRTDQVASSLNHLEEWDVDVLTAGTRLPDTLSSMMSQSLGEIIDEYAEKYDYILVDGAPAFVADALVSARHVDLLLLVARPGVIDRHGARQTLEMLDRVDATKGLVLNGVTRGNADYNYSGSYYYYGQSDDSGEQRKVS